MVCQRPIQPVLIWRTYLEPYEIFDLDMLIGPTSVTWNSSYDQQFDPPCLVESHVEELRELYCGIARLILKNGQSSKSRLLVGLHQSDNVMKWTA